MEEAAAAAIPEDMVLEILARVKDVAALFRCAMACKGWRRLLISDPSFLRRSLPEDACSSDPLSGFFANRRPPHAPLRLVPVGRPVFGRRRRSLGSFISNLNPRFFDNAVPLVSRHGLLLVRLNLYHAGVSDDQKDNGLLAVCNLLAGTLDVLPRLEHDCAVSQDLDKTGYAIFTTVDCTSGSKKNDQQQRRVTFFKVLVIDIAQRYRLRTFSSAGEPRWNMCAGNMEGGSMHPQFSQHRAVVCRGIAQWLFESASGFYTFDVSAKTGHVSFTAIPAFPERPYLMGSLYDEPSIGVDAEGRLTLMYIQRRSQKLEIQTLHDTGWQIHTLTLLRLDPTNTYGMMRYTCLGEKSGKLLINGGDKRVYVADAKTGVIKGVTDWPHGCELRRKNTVLLEMDWPAFLVSRLGKKAT